MSHPFRVAYAYDYGLFAVMKSLLESEGLTVLDFAMGGHLSIAGADQGYYIEVATGEKAEACQILRDNEFGQYVLDNTGQAT